MRQTFASITLLSLFALAACGGEIERDPGDPSSPSASQARGALLYVGVDSGHRRVFAARPEDGTVVPFGGALPSDVDSGYLELWQNADGTRALLSSHVGLLAGDGTTWRKIADTDVSLANHVVSADLQTIGFTDAGKAHLLSFDGQDLLGGQSFPALSSEAAADKGSAFAYATAEGLRILRQDGTESHIDGSKLRVAALFPSSVLVGAASPTPNFAWYSLDGDPLTVSGFDSSEASDWRPFLVHGGQVHRIADRSLIPLGKAPAALDPASLVLADERLGLVDSQRDGIYAFDARGQITSRYARATPDGAQRFGGTPQATVSVDCARVVDGIGTIVVSIEVQETRGDSGRLDFMAYEVWRTDGTSPYVLGKLDSKDGEFVETPVYRISPNGRFVSWVADGRLQAMDAATGEVTTLRDGGMEGVVRHNVDPSAYVRFDLD